MKRKPAALAAIASLVLDVAGVQRIAKAPRGRGAGRELCAALPRAQARARARYR